jgi:hypothetical protein
MSRDRWWTLMWVLLPLSGFTGLLYWVHKGNLNWVLVGVAWALVVGFNMNPPPKQSGAAPKALAYAFGASLLATLYGLATNAPWTGIAGAAAVTMFLASMYWKTSAPRDSSR